MKVERMHVFSYQMPRQHTLYERFIVKREA
jgi:hypothetical protein